MSGNYQRQWQYMGNCYVWGKNNDSGRGDCRGVGVDRWQELRGAIVGMNTGYYNICWQTDSNKIYTQNVVYIYNGILHSFQKWWITWNNISFNMGGTGGIMLREINHRKTMIWSHSYVQYRKYWKRSWRSETYWGNTTEEDKSWETLNSGEKTLRVAGRERVGDGGTGWLELRRAPDVMSTECVVNISKFNLNKEKLL